MTTAIPTLIRGVLYSSQVAAAAALCCTPGAICNALREGRENTVGLKFRGRGNKPCFINGHRYPSRNAAAAALGVSRVAIHHAIRDGRHVVRINGGRSNGERLAA